jgi:hypothetical protein
MAYFYLLRHNQSGKQYAGVRYARDCDPSELLVKYFTSSRRVKKLLGDDPHCFEIVETILFDSKEEAIEYELNYIKEHNAHLSDEWFNQAAAKAINPEAVRQACLERYGVENWTQTEEYRKSGLGFKPGNKHGCFSRSEETKQKMSEALKGRVFSEEHKQKIREFRLGSKASEKTKHKMSEAKRGKPRPASFSEKMSVIMKGENNPMYGRVSLRKGKKDPVIVCEHCEKEASKGNYLRWHGDNCRHKSVVII